MVSVLVLPIPNQFGSLWVNFNSPLLWDVFAISTYLPYQFSGGLVYYLILRCCETEQLPLIKEFIPSFWMER
jgi:hypothetical protein